MSANDRRLVGDRSATGRRSVAVSRATIARLSTSKSEWSPITQNYQHMRLASHLIISVYSIYDIRSHMDVLFLGGGEYLQ